MNFAGAIDCRNISRFLDDAQNVNIGRQLRSPGDGTKYVPIRADARHAARENHFEDAGRLKEGA